MSEWMFERTASLGRMTAADIFDCAAHGDELALQSVRREGYYLGLGLANLVTLFAPDVIALGGGVMKSSHWLMEHALNVVHGLCTQVPVEKIRIVLATLGSEAGLVGRLKAGDDSIHDAEASLSRGSESHRRCQKQAGG
jgi:predicted NBD/HSP70 family sugar kinase